MSTQLKDWQGRNIDPKTSGGGGGGSVYPSLTSITGASGARKEIASMPDGGYLVLDYYPCSNALGDCYSFRAKITSFSKLLIGRGNYVQPINNGYFTNTYCCWLEIDNTYVKVCRPNNVVLATYTHGLTISTWIAVNMFFDDEMVMNVTIRTLNGTFTQAINSAVSGSAPYWYTAASGAVKVVSDGSTLTDCKLSATNKYLHSPLWIFGASYESASRWLKWVRGMGYKNFLVNNYPGRGSSTCYNDLLRAFNYGCPKFLYWTMWGNGTPDDLDTYIGDVLELCEANGTELIIIDRPNSSAEDIQATYSARKEKIENYKAQGVRYVDAANALSSNPSEPDGWYSGYLDTDGKHPTELGDKSLAMQVLQDIPEIMQYGGNASAALVADNSIAIETKNAASTLTISADKLTVISGSVGTSAITLQVPNDGKAHIWDIMMTTGSSVNITFAMSNGATILKPSDFSVGASKDVEISVIGVGNKYYLRYGEFAS